MMDAEPCLESTATNLGMLLTQSKTPATAKRCSGMGTVCFRVAGASEW